MKHRARSHAPLAVVATLALSSCFSTGDTNTEMPQARPTVFNREGADGVQEPLLYARDGSVVTRSPGAEAPVPANADRDAGARRDVGTGDGGRMYLLELYQQVIDERDGLSQELRTLHADLEQERTNRAKAEARVAELENQLAALEADKTQIEAQNLELAGRLTTAQIRRLQAEKLLLETRILEQRTQLQGESASTKDAAAKAGGSRT